MYAMNEAKKEARAPSCPACANKHPGLRMVHHMALRSDDLEAHLIEQYGPAYQLDGRLQKRLRFVNEVRRILKYEYPNGGKAYSLLESYNLAVERLGLRNKAPALGGMDRSQPKEEN
jgi:hypothetical protein